MRKFIAIKEKISLRLHSITIRSVIPYISEILGTRSSLKKKRKEKERKEQKKEAKRKEKERKEMENKRIREMDGKSLCGRKGKMKNEMWKKRKKKEKEKKGEE